MSKSGISRINVFLIELIVMILVFAIASGILLRVFVRADQLSKGAADLSAAVIAAESVMERQLAGNFSELSSSVDLNWYDRDWQPVASEDSASFGVTAEQSFESGEAGTLVRFQVRAFDTEDNDEIYLLKTSQYYGGLWKEGDFNETEH